MANEYVEGVFGIVFGDRDYVDAEPLGILRTPAYPVMNGGDRSYNVAIHIPFGHILSLRNRDNEEDTEVDRITLPALTLGP